MPATATHNATRRAIRILPGPEALIFGVQHWHVERDRRVKIPSSKRNAAAAANRFGRSQILDFKDQHRHESENVPPWRPEIVPQGQRLIAEETAGRPFAISRYRRRE
jgi:hypothetical protein